MVHQLQLPGTRPTRLRPGRFWTRARGKNLHVGFAPTDTANYNNASKDVTIKVLQSDADRHLDDPDGHYLQQAISGTQLTLRLRGSWMVHQLQLAGAATYTPSDRDASDAARGKNLHVGFAPTDTANYKHARRM